MNHIFKYIVILLISLTLLAACSPSISDEEVGLLPTAVSSITTPTVTATTTISPTATIAVDGETVVPIATTVSSNQPAATAAVCFDAATFWGDIGVQDGKKFVPGVSFNKTWRLKNSGTCTWDHHYRIIHAGGHLLGATATAFPLPAAVAPGQTIDLSVSLVAPPVPDTYRGDWKLQNGQGQVFGIGANHNGSIWLEIKVIAPLPENTNSISGFAWQDKDQNNTVDSDEMLPQVTITLLRGTACDEEVRSVMTDDNGRYTFNNLIAGTYCLVGSDGAVTVSQADIELAQNQQLTDITVVWPPIQGQPTLPQGSITGWLWHDYCEATDDDVLEGYCVVDSNGRYRADGMIQPTEEYIAGVTVLMQVESCANNPAAPVSVVTDASGKYSFNNLPSGTYCVFVNAADNANILLPGDWTYPQADIWYQEISLSAGEQVIPVNFGWDYQLQ